MHNFVFNEEDNGGEQLVLSTEAWKVDNELVLNHVLHLNSYCNRATLDLTVQITPEKLRILADQLELYLENSDNIKVVS